MALSKSVKNTDSLSHRRINDHSDLCVDFHVCGYLSLFFFFCCTFCLLCDEVRAAKIKNKMKTATSYEPSRKKKKHRQPKQRFMISQFTDEKIETETYGGETTNRGSLTAPKRYFYMAN